MKHAYLCLLILLSFDVFAQLKFAGVLIDAQNGEPIEYAHISIPNSTVGTSSNVDGYFELSLEESYDSLVITHINYQKKRIHVSVFSKGNSGTSIPMEPIATVLKDVVVVSKTPYEYLVGILSKTRGSMSHPFNSKFYYRESVKDNDDYSKYSDAMLICNYPMDKDGVQVEVEQSRVVDLPRENDDAIDVISPVDVSKILQFQYFDFLNRFLGEKRTYYNFDMKVDAYTDKVVFNITPANKSDKNMIYYHGQIVAEANIITHVMIAFDTLSNWEKSMFGMTAKVKSFVVLLDFKKVNGNPTLVHGTVDLRMDFLHKRFNQKNRYLSEFIALQTDIGERKMDRRLLLRSKTIYKHGSKYNTPFWEGSNIPIRTEEERVLLRRLVSHDQTKSVKK